MKQGIMKGLKKWKLRLALKIKSLLGIYEEPEAYLGVFKDKLYPKGTEEIYTELMNLFLRIKEKHHLEWTEEEIGEFKTFVLSKDITIPYLVLSDKSVKYLLEALGFKKNEYRRDILHWLSIEELTPLKENQCGTTDKALDFVERLSLLTLVTRQEEKHVLRMLELDWLYLQDTHDLSIITKKYIKDILKGECQEMHRLDKSKIRYYWSCAVCNVLSQ